MDDYIAKRSEDIRNYMTLWFKRCETRLGLKKTNVRAMWLATTIHQDTLHRIQSETGMVSTYLLIRAVRYIGDDIDDVLPEYNDVARMLIELDDYHTQKGLMYGQMQMLLGYTTPHIASTVRNFDDEGFYRPPMHIEQLLIYHRRLTEGMQSIRAAADTIEASERRKNGKAVLQRVQIPKKEKPKQSGDPPTKRIPDDELTREATEMAERYLYELGARKIRKDGARVQVGYTDQTYEARIELINNRWGRLTMKVIHTGTISIDRRVDVWRREC